MPQAKKRPTERSKFRGDVSVDDKDYEEKRIRTKAVYDRDGKIKRTKTVVKGDKGDPFRRSVTKTNVPEAEQKTQTQYRKKQVRKGTRGYGVDDREVQTEAKVVTRRDPKTGSIKSVKTVARGEKGTPIKKIKDKVSFNAPKGAEQTVRTNKQKTRYRRP